MLAIGVVYGISEYSIPNLCLMHNANFIAQRIHFFLRNTECKDIGKWHENKDLSVQFIQDRKSKQQGFCICSNLQLCPQAWDSKVLQTENWVFFLLLICLLHDQSYGSGILPPRSNHATTFTGLYTPYFVSIKVFSHLQRAQTPSIFINFDSYRIT